MINVINRNIMISKYILNLYSKIVLNRIDNHVKLMFRKLKTCSRKLITLELHLQFNIYIYIYIMQMCVCVWAVVCINGSMCHHIEYTWLTCAITLNSHDWHVPSHWIHMTDMCHHIEFTWLTCAITLNSHDWHVPSHDVHCASELRTSSIKLYYH